MNLFNKKSAQERFWDWVVDNAVQLRAVKDGAAPVIQKLHGQLQRVHRDLTFEVGTADDGVFDLIISAGGIAATIPHVEKLVMAAPKIAGIRVIAFRQRHEGVGLKLNGIELSHDSVFYTSEDANGKLDLWLFIDGFNAETERQLTHACFLLLDSAIGEYDVMTQIGHISFAPLIEADGRQQPLSSLPQLVDAMKAS